MMMTTNTNTNSPTMLNEKDPLKIIYLDVGFQEDTNGRFALRSRSMTYFAAMRERKASIAWDAVAKAKTVDVAAHSAGKKFGLQIVNHQNQTLVFYMKDQADLNAIQVDIATIILDMQKNTNASHNSSPGSSNYSPEDSLLCFPDFVDSSSHRKNIRGDVASIMRTHLSGGGKMPCKTNATTATMEEESMQTGPRSKATRAGYPAVASARGGTHSVMDSSDDSTIATNFVDEQPLSMSDVGSFGGVRQHHQQPPMDPEMAMTNNFESVPTIGSSSSNKGSFAFRGSHTGSNNGGHYSSNKNNDNLTVNSNNVPVITVIPEQPTNPQILANLKYAPWEIEDKSTQRRSNTRGWIFCLLVALILLLTIGISIGIGVGIGRSSPAESKAPASSLVSDEIDTHENDGLENDTTSEEEVDPTPLIMQAAEREPEPTNAPSQVSDVPSASPTTTAPTSVAEANANGQCNGVFHSEAPNTYETATDAGRYGTCVLYFLILVHYRLMMFLILASIKSQRML